MYPRAEAVHQHTAVAISNGKAKVLRCWITPAQIQETFGRPKQDCVVRHRGGEIGRAVAMQPTQRRLQDRDPELRCLQRAALAAGVPADECRDGLQIYSELFNPLEMPHRNLVEPNLHVSSATIGCSP